MIDSDAHPALVGRQVVDAVGRHLAEFGIDEIMDPRCLRIALRPPFPAAVLEIADQFLLLGVDGNYRIACGLVLGRRLGDVLELCVSVRMLTAFPRLAHRLQAIVEFRQKVANAPLGAVGISCA